ncbi:MAG TPA: helix-turn-helix domain-containing protein [Xanthomonadaceae bacterium]|nr:helix-turn-helix domain-containing protein [Xanthomonadaceae bacterium]
MSSIAYMSRQTLLLRLGNAMRDARKRRGLTQAQLAEMARVPRLKTIQAEQGSASVSIGAYASLADALGMEFSLVPARRPTLDEVQVLLADE